MAPFENGVFSSIKNSVSPRLTKKRLEKYAVWALLKRQFKYRAKAKSNTIYSK